MKSSLVGWQEGSICAQGERDLTSLGAWIRQKGQERFLYLPLTLANHGTGSLLGF